MHLQRSVIAVAIGALLLAFAGAAQADVFSVTSANKNFCCTNPLAGIIAFNPHTATGLVTGSPATKYGPIQIGQSQVVYFMNFMSWYTGGATPPPPSFKYIIGSNSVVNGAGTLSSGGGYGSFEFCPKAIGPGVGSCANPGSATPSPTFNGRIAVKAGPKQFGGTLQLLAGKGGKGGSSNKIWRWLGGSMTYPAAVLPQFVPSTPVGGAPAQLKAIAAGPTQLVTHTPGSNPFVFQSFSMAMLSANGAGPFTTGTVYVGVDANGNPPTRTVSIMGVNNRTANGGGNIQVVSGLLFNTFQNIKAGTFPLGWQVSMTLPEPSPSLGLASGSVALLLIGLVGARRRNRNRDE